jgi:hypothetical protein
MNRIFSGLTIFILIISISSCSKKVVPYQGDGKMGDFSPQYASYNYLSAKAKIIIEEESGKVTRGSLSLRAKKDSVLWFTISPGMGMEAVRGLVTQDKIMIKDRIGKEDINLTFKEFDTVFGLKLSLKLFQNLLWANPPYPIDYEDRLIRVGKEFEITQVRNQVRYFSKVQASHGKVTESVSNSLDDRGSLLASFSGFQELESQPFPIGVLIKLAYQLPDGNQNTIINIEWTKIEPFADPLNFPFKF